MTHTVLLLCFLARVSCGQSSIISSFDCLPIRNNSLDSATKENKMMRSIAFLVLAIVAVSVSAFTGTPLQIARPSVAANRANGSSSLVMRERACDLLGKTANRKARVVTFSHKRIHKVQQVNLQWKRFYSGGLEFLIGPVSAIFH